MDNPSLYFCEKFLLLLTSQLVHQPSVDRYTDMVLLVKGYNRLLVKDPLNTEQHLWLQFYYLRSANQFVWIGCDKRDHVRKLGYALQGKRPVYH